MESNFVRERVNVKQNIIKKNVASSSKADKLGEPGISTRQIDEKILKYEEFINDKLKGELVEVNKKMDKICTVIAEYLQIRATIRAIKSRPRNLRFQTDLGCNFYAQCNVPDASKIYLDVGQGHFLHMDLAEAETMIDFKEKQLHKKLTEYQEKAANIKAYIKLVLEALGEIQGM